MLELNAARFSGALMKFTRMQHLLSTLNTTPGGHNAVINDDVKIGLLSILDDIEGELRSMGARYAAMSATSLKERIRSGSDYLSPSLLSRLAFDIEGRFRDEFKSILMFIIKEPDTDLYNFLETSLDEEIKQLYPSVLFDCDEAGKCLSLGRPTASVFHSMRILEIAIGAIAARLRIPSPARATDRSWGNMLRDIKTQMDSLHPRAKRVPGSEGAQLELVYASLDAAKNPWRNGTMHIEHKFTEDEARYILLSATQLIKKMAEFFDENGLGLS